MGRVRPRVRKSGGAAGAGGAASLALAFDAVHQGVGGFEHLFEIFEWTVAFETDDADAGGDGYGFAADVNLEAAKHLFDMLGRFDETGHVLGEEQEAEFIATEAADDA